MVNVKDSVSAQRTRLGDVGLLLGLLVLAGCGTGYREGAAADMDAGSDAHGEAIVAIAREMNASECGVFAFLDATESCSALRRELTRELERCQRAAVCDEALDASVEGEALEVAGHLAVVRGEVSMKAVRERAGRRWGLTPIR